MLSRGPATLSSLDSEMQKVMQLRSVTPSVVWKGTPLLCNLKRLEAKGGAKASAPEWESGGQRGRKKHGALFGGRGEESFICGSLPGSSCERRERRETERRETERERERERRERDERDEKEMREMREMRETVRQ